MRDVLRSPDATHAAQWHHRATNSRSFAHAMFGTFLFRQRSKEQRMHARMKVEVVAVSVPSPRPIANQSKPRLLTRIWTGLLAALHDSRRREAARVIHRHRDLIQDHHAIELLRL